MTLHEVVRRAVEFHPSERIPMRFGTLDLDDALGGGSAAAAG